MNVAEARTALATAEQQAKAARYRTDAETYSRVVRELQDREEEYSRLHREMLKTEGRWKSLQDKVTSLYRQRDSSHKPPYADVRLNDADVLAWTSRREELTLKIKEAESKRDHLGGVSRKDVVQFAKRIDDLRQVVRNAHEKLNGNKFHNFESELNFVAVG